MNLNFWKKHTATAFKYVEALVFIKQRSIYINIELNWLESKRNGKIVVQSPVQHELSALATVTSYPACGLTRNAFTEQIGHGVTLVSSSFPFLLCSALLSSLMRVLL